MSDVIKYTGLLVIIIITIYGIELVFGIVSLPFHSVSKQVDTSHEIVDTTYTASNAVENYEWFKNQYHKIQAAQNKFENTKEQMDSYETRYGNNASTWDYDTKQSYNQLETTYLGQKSYYEDLVSDYNARSEMANRNIFKDQLPMHVDSVLESTKI